MGPTGSTLMRCLCVGQKPALVAHASIKATSVMADVDYMVEHPQARKTPLVGQTTLGTPTALEPRKQSPYANKRPIYGKHWLI